MSTLTRLIERMRTLPALRREADIMGLTIALALLVALSTGSELGPKANIDVLAVLWATTLAIGLAHWFAEVLSAHLVKDDSAPFGVGEMLWAQLAVGLVIAVAASMVTLLVPTEYDRLGARVTVALSVAVLVGIERRSAGAPMSRAVVWAVGALLAALVLAFLKWLLVH